jgi:hypothetical protein
MSTETKDDIFDTLKDKMGRYRTLSLFVENKHPDYTAPYTLKRYNHRGALSMYLKYMEIGDPTEYKVAEQLLGSWKHWQVLSNAPWFKEYLDEWRLELQTRMESQRVAEMKDIVENNPGTPQAIQATKWLAAHYGTTKPKPQRGRPSKAEKEKLLREESEADKVLKEDAERLGL